MGRPNLRIYYGPADEAVDTMGAAQASGDRITVPLSEVFPLLADAVGSQRTWIQDFADDEVTISADLYDVLLAYQHCHRPSA